MTLAQASGLWLGLQGPARQAAIKGAVALDNRLAQVTHTPLADVYSRRQSVSITPGREGSKDGLEPVGSGLGTWRVIA